MALFRVQHERPPPKFRAQKNPARRALPGLIVGLGSVTNLASPNSLRMRSFYQFDPDLVKNKMRTWRKTALFAGGFPRQKRDFPADCR
jgi:hypothetical protein